MPSKRANVKNEKHEAAGRSGGKATAKKRVTGTKRKGRKPKKGATKRS